MVNQNKQIKIQVGKIDKLQLGTHLVGAA
jgi:hypothetical protein